MQRMRGGMEGAPDATDIQSAFIRYLSVENVEWE